MNLIWNSANILTISFLESSMQIELPCAFGEYHQSCSAFEKANQQLLVQFGREVRWLWLTTANNYIDPTSNKLKIFDIYFLQSEDQEKQEAPWIFWQEQIWNFVIVSTSEVYSNCLCCFYELRIIWYHSRLNDFIILARWALSDKIYFKKRKQ